MHSTAPKIKAIAPWFGGKRNLADRIVAELGEHRVYWEPFCGSMAVLLAKPKGVMETVSDLHGDLTNLARVIQHPVEGPRFYRRLRRTMMVEDLFRESAEMVRAEWEGDVLDPERAYHYFVTSWLGRNGVAGTSNYNHHFCVRYTANGGHAAKRWQSVVQSIPAWRRRLANVTVLRRDAFELIPKIEDKPGTAVYVDPPYLVKGATYVYDFGLSSARRSDPEKAWEAHSKLANQLGRFRTSRVVVSYYDDPRLAELYPGWTKVVIEVSKSLAHQGRRGTNQAKAREVLLVSGESFTDSAGRLF